MSSNNQLTYQQELISVAKHLGVPLRGDLQKAIIADRVRQIDDWLGLLSTPEDLTGLLDIAAATLGIEFEEIHEPQDLDNLLDRIPPSHEPSMARLSSEFDDETDAIMLKRMGGETWERPFLAVVNCQGRHFYRRFFSKWHEVAHRILEGPQLKLAFRRTMVQELRKDPEEILVDRVAAELAFYQPMFLPVLNQTLAEQGALSFEAVDQIRNRIAPDASRISTLLACIRNSAEPIWLVRCALGYKRQEERLLAQQALPGIEPTPQPQLRIQEVSGSPSAENQGIRFHKNMRIPSTSVVAQAANDEWQFGNFGEEPLEIWETSAEGPIGYGLISVEAIRNEGEIWALIRFSPEVRRSR